MDIETEYLESERLRAREWLADELADEDAPAFNIADLFIARLWREGFAIVPRQYLDELFGYVSEFDRHSPR